MSWIRGLRICICVVLILLGTLGNAFMNSTAEFFGSVPRDAIIRQMAFTSSCDTLRYALSHNPLVKAHDKTMAYDKTFDIKDGDVIFSTNYDTNLDVDLSEYQTAAIGYSPVVAVFPEKLVDDLEANFSIHQNGNNKSAGFIDMAKIIKILANTTKDQLFPSDFGFSADYDKSVGEISVALPEYGATTRRSVIDAIVYMITDGKEVTESNAEEVSKQLETVLSRMTNVKNPTEIIKDNRNLIMLFPECLLADVNTNSNLDIIYWEPTVAVKVNCSVKSNISVEEAKATHQRFKSEEYLFSRTGFRANDYSRMSSDLVYNLPNNVEVTYAQSNLESLLGYTYWL